MDRVDVMQPVGAGAATVPCDFSCTPCGEHFKTSADQRVHCKSERHLYNTKRRLANLKPISQEAWERKIRESKMVSSNKGTSHLKPGKKDEKKSRANSDASGTPGAFGKEENGTGNFKPAPRVADEDGGEEKEAAEGVAWTPCQSLFDRRSFESVEKSLEYMKKKYCFEINDTEYCTDLPGYLGFLEEKINKGGICLFCNRKFEDGASCRRHMIDKNHTRIGTEARTRRGLVDEKQTNGLENELEKFFDFHGSTREITERITDPKQKIASLLRYFDADRNDRLDRTELNKLWSTMNDGAELSDKAFASACKLAEVNPKVGFDAEELGALYEHGLADMDAHFRVLQDILALSLKPKTIKEEEGEDDEEDEDEEDDGEGSESEEGDDDIEYIEVDDMDEFAEVMRVLGLQKVEINEGGDLKLPTGHCATSRDVQHIYKQRGQRVDRSALAIVNGDAKIRNKNMPYGALRSHAKLMLQNDPSYCKVSMTQRQEAREGKRYVAMLRRKACMDMKVTLWQNLLQTQNRTKIRTGMGDMSNGR